MSIKIPVLLNLKRSQTRGLAAALGLLGGMVTAAAERMRKQEERAEQLAAAYRADSERIRAAADEIADEKRLDYHDPQPPKPAPSATPQQGGQTEPLDSATRSYTAWAKAVEEGRFNTAAYARFVEQENLSKIACVQPSLTPKEQPKLSWWDRASVWLNQNETKQRAKNAAIGFLSGLTAGCITGALGGAVVGSLVGGVGAGPGALGGMIIGGITGGISGLVTGLLANPVTPTNKVVIQSAIWGGVTGFFSGGGAAAAGIQGFIHGGQAWHVGLETTSHLNIVHIGVHSNYGLHIAFGAVKPYVANLHIYIQKSLPFFRLWKP